MYSERFVLSIKILFGLLVGFGHQRSCFSAILRPLHEVDWTIKKGINSEIENNHVLTHHALLTASGLLIQQKIHIYEGGHGLTKDTTVLGSSQVDPFSSYSILSLMIMYGLR